MCGSARHRETDMEVKRSGARSTDILGQMARKPYDQQESKLASPDITLNARERTTCV